MEWQVNEQDRTSFRQLVSSYNDENYFSLMRNYLGIIHTPFSKENLIARLLSFLSKETTLKHIVSMLDDEDITILTAVELLGQVKGAELAQILSQKNNYPTILRRISNLQERLLLLSEKQIVCINPLLKETIGPYLNLRVLFGNHNRDYNESFCVNAEVIRGLLSLTERGRHPVYKTEFAACFPSCDPQQFAILYPRLIETLEKLGIIDGQASIDFLRCDRFFSLSDTQIVSLCIAIEKNLPQAYIMDVVTMLEKLIALDNDAAEMLIRILASKYQIEADYKLLEDLGLYGVLSQAEGLWVANRIEEKRTRTTLVVDSDNTVSYSGACSEKDILYRFASLSKLDRRTVYQVSRQSFCKALDGGLTYEEIAPYLIGESYPQSANDLLKNLMMLSEQYNELSIYQGIVIKANDRIARLIENVPDLQGCCLKKLDEHVFLMDSFSYEKWGKTLRDILGVIPAIQNLTELPKENKRESSEFIREESEFKNLPIARNLPAKEPSFDKVLHDVIQEKSLPVSVKQNLLSRFEQKLILDKSQIANQVVNGSIEAGGFDYQGKLALCRQAIGKPNMALLLQLADQDVMVQPLELVYTVDKEAMLKAQIMPSLEIKIIPVSKVFLVRLFKYCLF